MSTTPPVPSSIPDPAQPKPLPHLGEEYGTGRGNLPPAKIVAVVLAVILVVVGILAWVHRPQSSASGSIDDVVSTEIPGQNSVMVAINVTLLNNSKTSFKMREVSTELDAGDGPHKDDPASAVDFSRYLQAFPALKEHELDPFKVETIPSGGQSKGRIIVTYPVTPEAFASRKSLKVTISAYGEPAPLVLVK